ncbi:MAG: hypothetical protein IKO27_05530 [Ruminococcus sp.]|nr:hypothetical protein [Ruminococcus sp.]
MNVTDEMTTAEFARLMEEEYGDEFDWWAVEPDMFVRELITELGEDDEFIRGRKVYNALKCESCDDMLFCSADSAGGELWRIYHLTFSHCREKEGWPRRKDFADRRSALEYIMNTFIEDHLS